MILYHGSNIEIEKIDLNRSKPFKDFGRGFYTTPLQEQAWTMAKRTARIYGTGNPCVTEFFLEDDLFSDTGFKIKNFVEPNNAWAQFVVNNRNHNFQNTASLDCNVDSKYDIVMGPVANDDIAALINVYLIGIISDDALTKELSFRELTQQVSFHTEKSIALLRKARVYYE